MIRLFVIRHGETEWSLSGQHTGVTDIPLTAHGEAQARALAPWLRPVRFAHVFTSPRLRAQRTCALAGQGAAAQIEPDLAEWDYGAYEGQRSADIRAHRPDWTVFRDGCPDGESPEEIASRADALIVRLDGMEGNVALFSHGHFSCVLAARWIGLKVIDAQHLALSPAAVGILGYAANHPDTRVIALWNAEPGALGGGGVGAVGVSHDDGQRSDDSAS